MTYQRAFRVYLSWEGDSGPIHGDERALADEVRARKWDISVVAEQDPHDDSNWYLRLTWPRVPAEDAHKAVVAAAEALDEIVGVTKHRPPGTVRISTSLLGPGD
jgi:hypothetical protein